MDKVEVNGNTYRYQKIPIGVSYSVKVYDSHIDLIGSLFVDNALEYATTRMYNQDLFGDQPEQVITEDYLHMKTKTLDEQVRYILLWK